MGIALRDYLAGLTAIFGTAACSLDLSVIGGAADRSGAGRRDFTAFVLDGVTRLISKHMSEGLWS